MKLPRRVRSLLLAAGSFLATILLINTYRRFRTRPVSNALLQVQLLDFLNGETGLNRNEFGGSLRNHGPFNATAASLRVFGTALSTIASTYNRTDFGQLVSRARVLRIAYQALYEDDSHPLGLDRTTLHSIVEESTHTLYPWVPDHFKSIRNMQTTWESGGDGLVFTTGHWHFELCLHAILSLRNVLNCSLPIEVHHAGPGDLSTDMIDALKSIRNVTVINVLEFYGEEGTKIVGWAIKPFAILASKFRRVIFVDADALFFQDPSILLTDSKIFKQYGQLFYPDRTIGRGDAKWFRNVTRHPTNFVKTLRYMNRKSSHEMESGVVVGDKARPGVLHGLLLVCKMNSYPERNILYDEIHGDKESFWFAWDVLRVPFAFASKQYGGTVGYKKEEGDVICGGLYHTDEYAKPLWWNGSVLKNKHGSKEEEFMTYEYAAVDSTGVETNWIWETSTTPFCLIPRFPKTEIIRLNDFERSISSQYVELYRQIKETGWKEYLSSINIK